MAAHKHSLEILIKDTLVQKIVSKTVQSASDHLKTLTLADEKNDGKTTYSYWDVRFICFTMNPSQVKFKSSTTNNQGKGLLIDITQTGTFKVVGNWRVRHKKKLASISTSGGIELRANNFVIQTQIELKVGTEDNISAIYDNSWCKVCLEGFDVHFNGSNVGFLLNLAAKYFKGKIQDKIENSLRNTINAKVPGAIKKIEDSTTQHQSIFHIPLLEQNVNLTSSLTWVEGNEGTGKVGINMSIANDKISSGFKDKPNFDFIENINELSDDPEYRIRLNLNFPLVQDEKISVINQETEYQDSNLTIKISPHIFNDLLDILHKLNLLEYSLSQIDQTKDEIEFQRYWNNRVIGPVKVSMERPQKLKLDELEIKLICQTPPTVEIDETGIKLKIPLKIRITVSTAAFSVAIASGKLEIPVEITTVVFLSLDIVDGKYRLIPRLSLNIGFFSMTKDIVFGSKIIRALAEDQVQRLSDELESTLRILIAERIGDSVFNDILSDGFPLNIPNNLVLGSRTIEYKSGFALLHANVVDVIMT